MALKIKIQWFNIKVLNHQIVKLNQPGSRWNNSTSKVEWESKVMAWGIVVHHDQGEGYEVPTVHVIRCH